MSDIKQEVEQQAVAAENAVVAFIRANALKAVAVSAIVGAIVGHIA